jgi:MFS family permease
MASTSRTTRIVQQGSSVATAPLGAGVTQVQSAVRTPTADPNFLVFSAGNFINNVGNAMYEVALPLLVLTLTGSLQKMSLVSTAGPVVLLLFPLIGLVVDRYGSRAACVPGLVIQAVGALVMVLMLQQHMASITILFSMALLIEFGSAIYRLGWQVGVPLMFPAFAVRARGILNTLFFLSLAIGPLLVSFSLHWTTLTTLFWVNLATCLAPILVWCAGVRPESRTAVQRESRQGFRASIRQGWKAVAGDSRLRAVTIVRALLALTFGPALIPLLIYRMRVNWHLSVATSGWMIAIYTIFTLVANIAIVQRGKFQPRHYLCLSMGFYVAAALTLAGPWLPVFGMGLVLLGLANGMLLSTYVLMPIRYLKQGELGRGSAFIGLVVGVLSLACPGVITLLSHFGGTSVTLLIIGIGPLAALGYLFRGRWDNHADPVTAGTN